ncbi:MAG TPA: hypothetical protein VGR85_08960 [Candidatus Limnocylindria bacterium]|nr:hypothetical protein [Candidatus Limnocylindria bacterium]
MRAFGVALALLIGSSCSAPTIPVLRVVRYSEMHPVAAFDRSVNDAAAAQRLHDALISLPVAQLRWCAIGYGIGYRLTFSDTSRTTLVATVESDGCREAILPGNDRRATNDAFWSIFADTLGLDARNTDQLFPQPLSLKGGTGQHAPVLRDRFAPRRL